MSSALLWTATVSFLLLSSAPVHVQSTGGGSQQRLSPVKQYGFALELPVDWEPIPDSMVMDLAASVSEAAGRPINYAAGFQVGLSEFWLEYPYVLVQVEKVGPITEKAYVEALTGIGWDDIVDETRRTFVSSNFVEEADLHRPVWDPDDRILWMRFSGHHAAGVEFEGISAHRLYRHGVVMVHYYFLPGTDTDRIRQTLANVITGISFEPGYEYNPGAARSQGFSNRLLGRVIGGALAGAVLGGIAALFGRRKQPDLSDEKSFR